MLLHRKWPILCIEFDPSSKVINLRRKYSFSCQNSLFAKLQFFHNMKIKIETFFANGCIKVILPQLCMYVVPDLRASWICKIVSINVKRKFVQNTNSKCIWKVLLNRNILHSVRMYYEEVCKATEACIRN